MGLWKNGKMSKLNRKSTRYTLVISGPFDTSDAYIYLKHTAEMFALEPTIIKILHDQFHASVPTVIDCGEKVTGHSRAAGMTYLMVLSILKYIAKGLTWL